MFEEDFITYLLRLYVVYFSVELKEKGSSLRENNITLNERLLRGLYKYIVLYVCMSPLRLT